ncbi:hypothetical protein [Microbulbifer variabilis]|uniref:hypothetical protein n=1 Tax=Microbulbifer variabilis TaxID=266805 RepID=UPI001CFED19B|nr:hypothetical protein [Microbulbifer variabilis]
MSRIIIGLILLALFGCASQGRKEPGLPNILNFEGKNYIFETALKDYEIEISKPESSEFTVNFPKKEPPNYYNCGGVYSDRSLYGQRILEEADLVLDFKGVKEVWVPLDGESKKIYIFEVR